MRILLFTLASLTISLNTFAQGGHFSSLEAKRVQQSTTYFILDKDNDSEYNQAIKKIVPQVWTFSEYKFATYDQRNEVIKDPNNSTFSRLNFYSGGVGYIHDGLGVMLSEKIQYWKIGGLMYC